MFGDPSTLTSRIILLLGPIYLVYMALQPPPTRWVGLACLAVLTPFAVGWLLGRYADVGPWAE
ncbi:hypothetical protein NDI56_05070 [Haloarcula sp. S1CR25-12]|uniref:Uncharacterized protein n=1 Tax=Haloarcula saliterrae TaxID=2950534 RepID=A0ABU2F919_9EURY|nr:hypothetical protein [Haloarcula sp. S1CR25-12]MDS0258762.1 hypothetical protein [Haloarcula sp. S1CR25-12]